MRVRAAATGAWHALTKNPTLRLPRDSQTAVLQFTADFEQLYGPVHPDFYIGALAQAELDAKREHRLLVVYAHSPLHDSTAPFCQAVLATELLRDFLRQHQMLFWAGTTADVEGMSCTARDFMTHGTDIAQCRCDCG